MMEPPLAVCRVGGPWRRATWIRRAAWLCGRLAMNVRPARRSGLPAVRRSRRDRAGPGDLVVLIHVPLPGEGHPGPERLRELVLQLQTRPRGALPGSRHIFSGLDPEARREIAEAVDHLRPNLVPQWRDRHTRAAPGRDQDEEAYLRRILLIHVVVAGEGDVGVREERRAHVRGEALGVQRHRPVHALPTLSPRRSRTKLLVLASARRRRCGQSDLQVISNFYRNA